MFKSLKISCDEATMICDKNQYGEASIKELIKLNLHLLKCKICKAYTKHNILLTRFYKSYSKSCKPINNCMPKDDKEALKAVLKKQIQE
jgi:hypothetical protein